MIVDEVTRAVRREATFRERYPEVTDAEVAAWLTHAPKTFDAPTDRVSLPPFADIVAHLAATDPDTWWAGPTFRDTDAGGRTCHCVLSHVHERWGARAMGEFEERFSTSFVIGHVNDGENPRYPQAHAKDRCLAFLADLAAGAELTTYESLEADFTLSCRTDLTTADLSTADALPHTTSTTEKNGAIR
jgi:hypothetical protein